MTLTTIAEIFRESLSDVQMSLCSVLTFPCPLCCAVRSVLAQRGYFKERAFVNYLHYLQYWKQQEYAKFLK